VCRKTVNLMGHRKIDERRTCQSSVWGGAQGWGAHERPFPYDASAVLVNEVPEPTGRAGGTSMG